MTDPKRPNILDYIEDLMSQGYSEGDAALMYDCLYSDCFETE